MDYLVGFVEISKHAKLQPLGLGLSAGKSASYWLKI